MKKKCRNLKEKSLIKTLEFATSAKRTSKMLRKRSHKCLLKLIQKAHSRSNPRTCLWFKSNITALMQSCFSQDSHSWRTMLKVSPMWKLCTLSIRKFLHQLLDKTRKSMSMLVNRFRARFPCLTSLQIRTWSWRLSLAICRSSRLTTRISLKWTCLSSTES